jgi:hypothetical protein
VAPQGIDFKSVMLRLFVASIIVVIAYAYTRMAGIDTTP